MDRGAPRYRARHSNTTPLAGVRYTAGGLSGGSSSSGGFGTGGGVRDGGPTHFTFTSLTWNSPPVFCTRTEWTPLVRRTVSPTSPPLPPSVIGSPSTYTSTRPPPVVLAATR